MIMELVSLALRGKFMLKKDYIMSEIDRLYDFLLKMINIMIMELVFNWSVKPFLKLPSSRAAAATATAWDYKSKYGIISPRMGL